MLTKAAKTLPDKFWAPPNFASLNTNTKGAFWEIIRMCDQDQVHHYNLVHLLHLPYLLRSDKESTYNTYAKIACITASRELLNLFIAFRVFQGLEATTLYCRSAAFLALMAAMTVLLAHINGHKLGTDDWRARQRHSDRARVEQLLKLLDMLGHRADDSMCRKGAEQLRRLLAVESDAARGVDLSAHSTVRDLEQSAGELQLHIPYFGIIKIGQEGITKDDLNKPKPAQPLPDDFPHSVFVANHLISTAGFGDALHLEPQPQYFLPIDDAPLAQASRTPMIGEDLDPQQMQNPSLMASVND